MTHTFWASSIEELDTVAAQLLEAAGNRKKWLFYGEMGTGKTTLIKALCRQLGVQDTTSSPTYALIHTYQTDRQTHVHHADLYRLRAMDMNTYAELETYLYDDAYFFIEWADILGNFSPSDCVSISVLLENDEKRKIQLDF